MSTCTTCKHKKFEVMTMIFPSYLKCKHPSIPVNPVTGKQGEDYCSIQRRGFGPCGPNGVHHEQA